MYIIRSIKYYLIINGLNKMNVKKILLITLIAVAIFVSVSAVSAGWFDLNDDATNDIKTHEFNYVDRVSFI